MKIKRIEYSDYSKIYMTIDLCGKNMMHCLQKLNEIYEYISNNKIEVIYENFYGEEKNSDQIIYARDMCYEKYNIDKSPMMFLQGTSCANDEMNGISVMGIIKKEETSIRIKRVLDEEVLIGTVIDSGLSEEIYLISIHGENGTKKSCFSEEMNNLYSKVVQLLNKYNYSVDNIYRTYFYLRNLLIDYESFNDCRKEFFDNFYGKVDKFPASTCIMGHSIYGDRVVSNIFARKTKCGNVFTTINTSEQCEAMNYNKLFSRGTWTKEGNVGRAYISGTASIDKAGNTVFKEMPDKQIEQTFKCVSELLKNVGMKMEDIVSGQVYIKKKEYFNIYTKIRDAYGLINIPCINMEADVCRNDLLFEMDLIAEKENNDEG